MGSLADDVLGLLQHLGIGSAVVGGVSMGGYVAMALLRNDPGRVQALVLADTQMSADDGQTRANREAIAQDVLANGTAVMVPRSTPLLSPAASDAQRARMVSWILGTRPRESPRPSGDGRPSRRPRITRFAGPLLAVVGREDVLTPPAKARAIAELVPGAELVEIADAGHLSNVERPEAFNAALGRFLDRLPG
jgi:pimeloyl-ACP methyl ester carboxylesterase